LSQFVLDASVSLAWFLDRPVPDLAVRVWQQLQEGARSIVPALWTVEMANGFATAERRGALTRSNLDRCLADIEMLMGGAIEYAATAVSLRQAFGTATAFRLTAYDAVYLEMARAEHLPLATLDRALIAAASTAGVSLFA
jgi:predicted nucleic acid-binding protein